MEQDVSEAIGGYRVDAAVDLQHGRTTRAEPDAHVATADLASGKRGNQSGPQGGRQAIVRSRCTMGDHVGTGAAGRDGVVQRQSAGAFRLTGIIGADRYRISRWWGRRRIDIILSRRAATHRRDAKQPQDTKIDIGSHDLRVSATRVRSLTKTSTARHAGGEVGRRVGTFRPAVVHSPGGADDETIR